MFEPQVLGRDFNGSGVPVRPIADSGVRLVWSRLVDDPDGASIYGVFIV